MSISGITLVTFGYFDETFIKQVSRTVQLELGMNVSLVNGHLDLSEFFDSARRQYNADKLLKEVDLRYGTDSSRTAGLFNADLYIPILTYVFGLAWLRGRTGIVSAYRLNNEIYGISPDIGLVPARFSKEIIHELGHTLGLVHCTDPSCVMRSSTYLEDLDQKSMAFCESCREAVRLFLQEGLKQPV
ncbi:MAG TPA: archaemetzincin family Zn-dependent metalloprotease [Bacteroidales bacterium]|jgi:archaemetzincin|nr:archaemetzincin family Zn-dependent metalloprotease [Bacteroidales bacterium]